MIGTLAVPRAFGSPWLRRAIFIVLVAICVALALFPERYRAAATLAPSDPATLGLSGTLSQLGANNTVFGSQAAIEISLKVASGVYVRQIVARQLHVTEHEHLGSELAAMRWLDRQVTVRSVRGGILLIETWQHDPDFARQIVDAYATATRSRLAAVNRQQTGYKRRILDELVAQSSERLAKAQQDYDLFRLRARYPDPSFSIAAVSSRIPQLRQQIEAKQVQLNAERQFAADDNISVRQIVAQLTALRRQLAEAETLNPSKNSSVGEAVQESTRGKELQRKLLYAQALYDSYSRFLEGTAVEDMTSTANLRVLEPPYIDTQRQFNVPFVVAGILLALLGLAIEFYQLRPPLEARIPA